MSIILSNGAWNIFNDYIHFTLTETLKWFGSFHVVLKTPATEDYIQSFIEKCNNKGIQCHVFHSSEYELHVKFDMQYPSRKFIFSTGDFFQVSKVEFYQVHGTEEDIYLLRFDEKNERVHELRKMMYKIHDEFENEFSSIKVTIYSKEDRKTLLYLSIL